jgi:hypothetical protein
MRRLRRYRLLFAAALCAGLAVLLVLFAADVAAWRSAVTRDDLRFRALPSHRGLWRPSTTLPFDPASLALGTSSAIQWRRALQYFWFTRINVNPDQRMDPPTLRGAAQNRLLAEMTAAPTAAERSVAANLLGVLAVTTPVPGHDPDVLTQIVKRAEGYFQQAVELDGRDTDAKQNLELLLRIAKPGKSKLGRDARSAIGFGLGNAVEPRGSGY